LNLRPSGIVPLRGRPRGAGWCVTGRLTRTSAGPAFGPCRSVPVSVGLLVRRSVRSRCSPSGARATQARCALCPPIGTGAGSNASRCRSPELRPRFVAEFPESRRRSLVPVQQLVHRELVDSSCVHRSKPGSDMVKEPAELVAVVLLEVGRLGHHRGRYRPARSSVLIKSPKSRSDHQTRGGSLRRGDGALLSITPSGGPAGPLVAFSPLGRSSWSRSRERLLEAYESSSATPVEAHSDRTALRPAL
jgi:hypothetical protein